MKRPTHIEFIVPSGDNITIVKMTSNDLGCPCRGTHVNEVAEIGGIEIKKITRTKKSHTKIYYSVYPFKHNTNILISSLFM